MAAKFKRLYQKAYAEAQENHRTAVKIDFEILEPRCLPVVVVDVNDPESMLCNKELCASVGKREIHWKPCRLHPHRMLVTTCSYWSYICGVGTQLMGYILRDYRVSGFDGRID